jgi:hypothetical protein
LSGTAGERRCTWEDQQTSQSAPVEEQQQPWVSHSPSCSRGEWGLAAGRRSACTEPGGLHSNCVR